MRSFSSSLTTKAKLNKSRMGKVLHVVEAKTKTAVSLYPGSSASLT